MRTPTSEHLPTVPGLCKQGRILYADGAGSRALLHVTSKTYIQSQGVTPLITHQHEMLVGVAAAAGCQAQHPLAVRARLAHLRSTAVRQQRQEACAARSVLPGS